MTDVDGSYVGSVYGTSGPTTKVLSGTYFAQTGKTTVLTGSFKSTISMGSLFEGTPTIVTGSGILLVVTESKSQNTIFLKRGWYPTTKQYEFWKATTREESPPSGHTLIDITILSQITQ